MRVCVWVRGGGWVVGWWEGAQLSGSTRCPKAAQGNTTASSCAWSACVRAHSVRAVQCQASILLELNTSRANKAEGKAVQYLQIVQRLLDGLHGLQPHAGPSLAQPATSQLLHPAPRQAEVGIVRAAFSECKLCVRGCGGQPCEGKLHSALPPKPGSSPAASRLRHPHGSTASHNFDQECSIAPHQTASVPTTPSPGDGSTHSASAQRPEPAAPASPAPHPTPITTPAASHSPAQPRSPGRSWPWPVAALTQGPYPASWPLPWQPHLAHQAAPCSPSCLQRSAQGAACTAQREDSEGGSQVQGAQQGGWMWQHLASLQQAVAPRGAALGRAAAVLQVDAGMLRASQLASC